MSAYSKTVGNVKCEQVEIHGLLLHGSICSNCIHMFLNFLLYSSLNYHKACTSSYPSESILKYILEFKKKIKLLNLELHLIYFI